MNRYSAPEIKDLPSDIKARVLEVQEKAGFVPNVFLGLARRLKRGIWLRFVLCVQSSCVPC